MSQTSCECCHFPVPTRWLHAGGDLSQPNHIHQYAGRPLTRSEGVLKCPGQSPDLPCVPACRCCRAGVPPAIDLSADIKSP
jgi:hypothetical protein